ncbi:hypothetical protein HYPSUDRAFT_64138 [Hypholoma sublateritium FD-334 SS-4]|uniref:Uncharacterized protein n=1 Tax=Hypholoma sublateritium (strain FD-334 SS-4) TaxID=945553 RepID=A0A0D2P667_HYPSF|nr:hypothetical protein HYPSUDRAFT_64138 [Hypholoma sublateritium FD-334 SS-4]
MSALLSFPAESMPVSQFHAPLLPKAHSMHRADAAGRSHNARPLRHNAMHEIYACVVASTYTSDPHAAGRRADSVRIITGNILPQSHRPTEPGPSCWQRQQQSPSSVRLRYHLPSLPYHALNMHRDLALPFDVLDAIVDTLAVDDTPMFTNLKPFSLTCKSLLHSCRKHIFKTIIIGLPIPTEGTIEDEPDDNWSKRDSKSGVIPPSRLCRLMSAQPQLSEYVRDFKYGINGDPSTYSAANPDISPVLRRFTLLQSLTLGVEHGSGHDGMVKWADIPRPIQDSVRFLIRLQTLTSLTLRNQIIPLFQIKIAANLHCLHIYNVVFEEENGSINLPDCTQPLSLHEYSTGNICADITSTVLNARLPDNRYIFDFSELWHLRAEVYAFPDHLDAVDDVISRTTQLKTLSLLMHTARGSFAPFFGIKGLAASLNTLTRIAIHRRSPLSVRWSIPPLFGIYTGFRAIRRTPNMLEEIVLTQRLCFDALCDPRDSDLRKLDAVLGSAAWPCLRKVCIIFYTNSQASGGDHDDPDMRDVETVLRQHHFPTLSSSGTVSFSITISRNLIIL